MPQADAASGGPVSGELLDELAGDCFGSAAGAERIAPLVARWDERVGPPAQDVQHRELLQAMRVDWALLDAPIPGGAGPGDRWVARALRGDIPEVDDPSRYGEAAHTYVGLFEVWPGREPWLRDRVRGLSLPLADLVHLEPTDEGPAALWEVRVWIGDGKAHMCRKPLPYPLAILPMLQGFGAARFRPGGRPVSMMRLRRARLQWQRSPRADAAALFSRLLR